MLKNHDSRHEESMKDNRALHSYYSFWDQHDSSFSDLKFWIIKVLAFLGSFFGIKFRFGDLKVLEYI